MYLVWLVAITGFWLLLSGYYTTWILSLGVISIALVLWFIHRMNFTDNMPIRIRLTPKLISYLVWLFVQVVKANLELGRRVLKPNMPIEPLWERLPINLNNDMERTLYANSVTLTPDTLTVRMDEDSFLVHALWKESVEGLKEGETERRIKEIGI